MPGGGGGVDLDVITAASGDVLKGKVIVGPDGEPLTGVLELTGNAADSQVLAGKTYYNTDAKTKRTGTMTNRGAVSPGGLSAGGSYTIPEGYHNGAGKVTANSLSSQTDGNATAGDILKGKTGWVKGSKVTGTMANHAGTPQHIDARRMQNNRFEVAVAAGYHGYSWAGNSYEYMELSEVASTLGLTAAKLAKGQTVCGVAGTYTSDADAVAGDILSGKIAYVKGSKVTGTLATMAGQTITPSASQQTISCSGKKMTGNVVVNAVPLATSTSGFLKYNYISTASSELELAIGKQTGEIKFGVIRAYGKFSSSSSRKYYYGAFVRAYNDAVDNVTVFKADSDAFNIYYDKSTGKVIATSRAPTWNCERIEMWYATNK